jgi:hypothetical protein
MRRCDPFIARGLDALNYACYQDARFILVATPSGITLAPEGGAHQSIVQPLIGMAQDGLASFEPAFVDELAVVLAWALAYIQKAANADRPEHNWPRDEIGGSVYLRLSTRPIEQPKRPLTPDRRLEIIDGAYWLRRPGPNCQVVVGYAGAVAPEAIQAVGLMAEDRRDVGLLAVTSADRLNAGWTAAQRARERGLGHARSHIEQMFDDVPAHAGIVTVLDGHPATLARRGRRPPGAVAWRRAFRTDRLDPRPVPAPRHRRERHPFGSTVARTWPPRPASHRPLNKIEQGDGRTAETFGGLTYLCRFSDRAPADPVLIQYQSITNKIVRDSKFIVETARRIARSSMPIEARPPLQFSAIHQILN